MGCGSSSDAKAASTTTDSGEGNGTFKPMHADKQPISNNNQRCNLRKENEAIDNVEFTTTEQNSDMASKALLVDIDMTCPSPTKIVRIFTSSTVTDTKNERNMLMKFAYPEVKEHCRRLGYEFQVVDMRWGVRDEATDDHMGTELCLKELKLCQEVSTGPNFVSLLSHKYGYITFPRVIVADEYDAIMTEVEEEEIKQLFQRWYTIDKNAVPPSYILSPISSRLPDFLSHAKKKKLQAKQKWWEENERMQNVLGVIATKMFDTEKARKYVMSVTETEITEGLLKVDNPSKTCLWFKRTIEDIEEQQNSRLLSRFIVTETEITEGLLKVDNPSKTCLWFKRTIEDIEEQQNSRLLSRFIECTGADEKWKKARKLLEELKDDKMAKKLSAKTIMSYIVKWNQTSGINPENDKQHQTYRETLCNDFVTMMTDMIDASVAERADKEDHLIDECCQHIRFCQSKCEGFQGRQETLELIKTYVQNKSAELMVLHGTGGTGKTSIMAMAAKMMKQWINNTSVLVLR